MPTTKYLYLARSHYSDPNRLYLTGWGTEVPVDIDQHVLVNNDLDEDGIDDLVHFLTHPTLAEDWVRYLRASWNGGVVKVEDSKAIVETARILAESKIPVPPLPSEQPGSEVSWD